METKELSRPMQRHNDRNSDELRPLIIIPDFQPQADSSLLIKMGNTHVLCAVTVEEKVPPFLKDSGQGWITAEYGMLPCATDSRVMREVSKGRSGRTYEIQRLIGRSLRMMVDLKTLGERTIRVDCDVINADGGTRTASITGAALAVRNALKGLVESGVLGQMPRVMALAAVSCGIVDGVPLLDLDYKEDSTAEADANFVMTEDGRWIEVQATAEGRPMSRDEFTQLTDLAQNGIYQLLELWKDEE